MAYRAGRGGGRGAGAQVRRRAVTEAPPQGDFSSGFDFEDGGDFDDDDGPQRDALYGVSPVLAALRSRRRKFDCLYTQTMLKADKPGERRPQQEVERLAAEAGVRVEVRDKGTLNGMCRNRPHQGLVLQASRLEFEPLNTVPPPVAGVAPLWLALDEVTDPQNFGALLRSAFFLGVDGVLVSAKNSCPLTPVVSKASAGAMELMTVHAARNLPRTLEQAREAGWSVVGAALERSVEPAAIDATTPTILVLGSEGHGLRTNVVRACTELVRIPRGPPTTGHDAGESAHELVDSLNVSVAGGILIWTLMAGRAPGSREN